MTQSDNDKTVISVGAGVAPSAGGIPRARLICLDTSQVEGTPKEMVVPLIDGQQTVGRSEECTFPIPSRRLSRQHARVFSGPNGWCVEDLNSTNGVHVDGIKVSSAWLTHGQEVRFGPVPFRFEIDQAVAVALPVAEADAEDEERTMMVGSAGASRAVLEAARNVDSVEPPPPPVKPVARSTGVKAVASAAQAPRGKSRLPLIVIICVLLGAGVGGGWVLYPRWERQKAIEDLRKTEERLSRDLIAVNQSGLTPKARDTQDDEAKRTAEIEAKRRALEDFRRDAMSRLSTDREYWPLTTQVAHVEFLLFEPRFAEALKRGDFTAAAGLISGVSDDIAGLEKLAPSDAEARELDALRTVRDLTRLATLIVNYRRFTVAHPQVTKEPTGRPNPTEVADLVKSQTDFSALLRGGARTMQLNYHLFFRSVKEAEERDIILINSWKSALAGAN